MQYIRRSGRTGRSAGRDDYANVTSPAAIQISLTLEAAERTLLNCGLGGDGITGIDQQAGARRKRAAVQDTTEWSRLRLMRKSRYR